MEALKLTDQLTPAWHHLVYHPVRAAAAQCEKRFVGIVAGRGSGKTEIEKRRLVLSLSFPRPWPNPRYFYAGPTFEHAKQIAWESLIALTPKNWVAEIRVGEGIIRSVFGSVIQLVGVDMFKSRHRTTVEGRQWDGGVIDESSDCPPGVFSLSILPALQERFGWCHRIGVPKRQGIGAAEFREWTATKADDRESFAWESADILDLIDPARLAYARDNMDPKDFNEQFRARWETAGGAIFHAWDAAANKRPCSYNPSMPIVVGMDFNVDPMCWVLGHHYRDQRRIEWFDELFVRGTHTLACLSSLAKRYAAHAAGWHFYMDAAGGQRQASSDTTNYKLVANDERFRRGSGRVIAFPLIIDGTLQANPPVAERFSACNALFAGSRMHVDPRCKRLIADIEARHYKPGTNEPNDKGDLGHMTDAMGYPVHALYPYNLVIERVSSTVITTRGV